MLVLAGSPDSSLADLDLFLASAALSASSAEP